jgi:outer membrane protein insertion porin family
LEGSYRASFRATTFATVLLGLISITTAQVAAPTTAPVTPTPTSPSTRPVPPAYAALRGKPVEDVRVMGNTQVSTAIILNMVRTRVGDRFDPATVEEDYQRIYGLKKFANVEAKAEPTATGVIVTFIVTEQRQIREITFVGNKRVDTDTLKSTVDLNVGEAIDPFRINIARHAIEALYQGKNFPYAHVDFDRELLAQRGVLAFRIVEGPNVRVRKVEFIGNHSFSDDRLKDEVQTKYWIWIFRPGTFDRDTLDDDVAALRRFYEGKGFFDVRVGRKVTESPDQSEIKVSFLVEEGPRYTVDKVSFKGNTKLSEAELLERLKLVPGEGFDNEILQRDVREIVRAYSPFGFIYYPQSQSPDYRRVNARQIFRKEAGKVELQYTISEGKPFKLGRVIVKGNTKTQDKVVLREMRVAPGQQYNAAEVQDATDRLRGTPYFQNATITPIGDDAEVRDLLVEVTEARTATFGVGAGINSNGGVGANITYEQRNFDLTNWPNSFDEILSDRAFIGAGQNFRITLEPGTQATNASIRFTEPWLFDQPYSFTGEVYYRDRIREDWDETRGGGRVTFGKRWDNVWSTSLTLRGEDVNVHDIHDELSRAPEITDLAGHSTVTSTILSLRRDTTNHGFIQYRGTNSTVAWESYGTLGGDFTFQKFTASFDWYTPLYEDLLDRRTVFALHGDAGWIWGSSPFFERFYAGGIGTVRGFQFRGISPRSGIEDDPVGGDFIATGSVEVQFPLVGESVRGVVFADFGTVEEDFDLGTIRSSVGPGIRLVLPFLGQAPLAIDFGIPITKDEDDETQLISFSFGFTQ